MIKKLTIKNIKNISDLTIDFTSHLALSGMNGAGKSTVLSCIKAIYNDLSADMLKNGEVNGGITAELSDGTIIERLLTPAKKTRLNGHATTAKSLTKYFASTYDWSVDSIKLMTSSDIFAALSGNSFINYIIDNECITNDVDINKLISICKITNADIENCLKDNLPKEISLTVITETAEDLNTTVKALKKNKQIAEAKLNIPEKATFTDESFIAPDIKFLKNEYASLLKHLGVLQKEMDDYDKNLLANKSRKNRMEKLSSFLSSVTKVVIPDTSVLDTLTENKTKTVDLYNRMNENISSQKALLNVNKKILKSLDTPVCPLCDKLVCKTDKTPLKNALSQAIADAETSIAKIQNIIITVKKQLDCIEQSIKEYYKTQNFYTRYESSKKEYESLKSIKIPLNPPDKKQLEDVNNKIVKIRNQITIAEKYEEFKKNEKKLLCLKVK